MAEIKASKKQGQLKALVKTAQMFKGDRKRQDNRKRDVEIRDIAKAIGMKIKDSAEMYDRTETLGNFQGDEDYEFGVDDFVLEVFDRICEDPSSAREVLLSYHRMYTDHEVDSLMKVAGVASESPSTSPGREAGSGVDLDRMFRALTVMRRLHLLAQVEGGMSNARRNWRDGDDGDDDGDDNASTSHYSVISKNKTKTRQALPPVKTVAGAGGEVQDRDTPRVLKKDVTGLQPPPSISDLRQELEQSSSILHTLDRAMKRDVALVSQNYIVNSDNAKKMSWVWGLEKLESVGKKTLMNYKWLAFKRMLRYDKYKQNVQHASQFMKIVNARIIGRMCATWLQRKFVDMFDDWKRR